MRIHVSRFLAMAALTTTLCVAASAQSISTSIVFPNAPLGLASDPIRNKIYVVAPANAGSANDNLAVIDGSNDTVVSNLPVPLGASFVAVDYVFNRLYVAGCNPNTSPEACTVAVLNGATGETITTIPVTTTPGLGLTGIVANPLDHNVYVANASDNVVNIICGFTDKLSGTIDLQGNSPSSIAINPIANRLYVPFGTNETAVISASKKTILSVATFGVKTVGVAVDLISGHVYVTDSNRGASQTGILDKTGAELAAVAVSSSPLGVDVDPFASLAFVANRALDRVTVIDGSTNTVKTVLTGVPASYVTVNPVSAKVYISGRTGVTVLTEN